MSDSEPFRRAYSAALRFLTHQPRSEAEMRARLLRRFSPPLVQKVVDALKERSMLDDAAFSAQWTQNRDALKPRSASIIRRELTGKGIDDAIAREAVREIDDEDSAYRAGLRHTRTLQGVDFATFRRRLYGYLARRGFSDSIARRTLRRLWSEISPEEGRELSV